MNSHSILRHYQRAFAVRPAKARQAFSLVEMLVALAIFLVLLTAVFVPIKLAGDLSGVATSRSQTQQAAVDGIRSIKADINKAIVILPNDRMAGVTDVYPYAQPSPTPNGPATTAGNAGYPYRRDPSGYQIPATAQANGQSTPPNGCGTGSSPAPNTPRLDLILPANDDKNSIDPNLRHNSVLVSYYARRRDITKAFDPINNPVVLYRAQIPFQYNDANNTPKPFPQWEPPYTANNADLSNQRFDVTMTHPCVSRSLQWHTMNQYGEFDLTPLALAPANLPPKPMPAPNVTPAPLPVFGSHQLVLPRDTALLTPNAIADTTAAPNPNMSLVPDTTFICSDANKDGKIDTVTIQLSVGQYDENSVNRRSSGTPGKSTLVPQVARTITETVFDPNIQ